MSQTSVDLELPTVASTSHSTLLDLPEEGASKKGGATPLTSGKRGEERMKKDVGRVELVYQLLR